MGKVVIEMITTRLLQQLSQLLSIIIYEKQSIYKGGLCWFILCLAK